MPLFGKKTVDKTSKAKEEAARKETKPPTVEDKYDLKDVLGT